MNPRVFREYDIRGNADRDLDDGFANDLGKAIGTHLKRAGAQKITLGRDCRVTSPRLHKALRAGHHVDGRAHHRRRHRRHAAALLQRSSTSTPTAACRSPARTIRPRTTASRSCAASRPSTAPRSRSCASSSRARDFETGARRGVETRTSRPRTSTWRRRRSSSAAPLQGRRRRRQRRRRHLRAASAAARAST